MSAVSKTHSPKLSETDQKAVPTFGDTNREVDSRGELTTEAFACATPLYAALTGSRLTGMYTPASDIDVLDVRIFEPEHYIGMYRTGKARTVDTVTLAEYHARYGLYPESTETCTGVTDDTHVEGSQMEIGEFIRAHTNGALTTTAALFAPRRRQVFVSEQWHEYEKRIQALTSVATLNNFSSFYHGQIRRIRATADPRRALKCYSSAAVALIQLDCMYNTGAYGAVLPLQDTVAIKATVSRFDGMFGDRSNYNVNSQVNQRIIDTLDTAFMAWQEHIANRKMHKSIRTDYNVVIGEARQLTMDIRRTAFL